MVFPPLPYQERELGRNSNAYNPCLNDLYRAQTAFMERIKPICQKMEERYGVPAAFLGAQIAQESGCGTTRIAHYANNLTALKFVMRWGQEDDLSGSALGAKTWQLVGQPDEAWDGSVVVVENLGDDDRLIFDEDRRYDNWYYAADSEEEFLDFYCRVCIWGTSFGRLYPEYLKLHKALRNYHANLDRMSKKGAVAYLAYEFGLRGYCHVELAGSARTAEERRGNYYKGVITNQMHKWGTHHW